MNNSSATGKTYNIVSHPSMMTRPIQPQLAEDKEMGITDSIPIRCCISLHLLFTGYYYIFHLQTHD